MQDQQLLPFYSRVSQMGGFPLVCAHRGGAEEFGPENTLYTYRKSVTEFHAQLLEIDIRITYDGELILLHDDDVDRTTNGTGNAKDMTLERLKSFDAAHNYPDLKGTGITIPTFKEFLDEFVQYQNLLFMLDIKDNQSVPLALQLVKEHGIEDRVLLGAVPPDSNSLLMQTRPKTIPLITDLTSTIAIITAYWIGALHWYTFEHDVVGFILDNYTTWFWEKGLVDALHKAGVKVLVCGDHLNLDKVQKECIEAGVDFVLSDRPDLLHLTMGQWKQTATIRN
jgi:glycerophosphoryl diester phosphodiesterase